MPEEKTCGWYVSIQQPECGLDAPYSVRVKGRVTNATVHLCVQHKKIHDENFARIRAARKSQTKQGE